MFSVLMSVYIKEKPSFLIECFESLLSQTVKAEQVVIVQDGPLLPELYEVLDEWSQKLPLTRVVLDKNVGLGKALNYGLEHCKHQIVARMDTDDVCHPQRFEQQLMIMQLGKIDICGSCVSEFETNPDNTSSLRSSVEKHEDIIRVSRFRNPMNHPAVMYRKSAVLEVGGYDNVLYFEDYHLWLKLIARNYKFYNIQKPLVAMRAGIGQLARRRGLRYALLEVNFFKQCIREGIMSKGDAIRNITIRFPLRIIPTKALSKVYKIIRCKGA